jgi:nucleotide-binding universal stress UspA family protein
MAAMHDWQDPARELTLSSFPLGAIVVPLDGTEHAKAALPIARFLSQLEGATLHVVYVGQDVPGVREAVEQMGLTDEEQRGVVVDRPAAAPADAVLSLANQLANSLVVMCTQTGGGAPEGISSLAEALLSAAPDRVMLVTPESGSDPWHVRLVLLAHDGTPSADLAIAPTAQLAHRAGAEVIALHVAARGAERPEEPGSLPAPRYIDQPQHEWPAWASEFVDRMLALGGAASAINFKLLVTGGQPGSEIAQYARDNRADLVVLPWHGHWERSGAVDAVVRRSGCPVLLICTRSEI